MLKIPVRFVPKENLIVDSENKVICHLFASRGESVVAIAEKAGDMVRMLNHACKPYRCEKCGRRSINRQKLEGTEVLA